jgi:hypothetical protein
MPQSICNFEFEDERRGGFVSGAGVWAVILYDTEWTSVSGWLAFAWSVASGGAWLLEVFDREQR